MWTDDYAVIEKSGSKMVNCGEGGRQIVM